MSAPEKGRRGVDTAPEERARSGGAVDPTGHVSSGIQTGSLRGGDERPVAATDGTARERLREKEDVTAAYRSGGEDEQG